MKVQDICHYLEKIAPLSYQESYDNAGLLVGDPDSDVQQLLVCLDVTPAVMEEAIQKKCNLIIAHHPLIFKGLTRLISGDFISGMVSAAIKHDISIYAIHTNLDNTLEGINGLLLRKLGISSYKVLAPKKNLLSKLAVFCPVAHAETVRNALFHAGAGHIGNYDYCSFNVAGKGSFRASDQANPFIGEKNQLHFEEEIKIEVIFPDHLQAQIVNSLRQNHPYEEVAFDIYPLKNYFEKIGAGAVGDLPEEVQETEFLDRIKQTLEIPVIRHSEFRNLPVKRVAICSGAGSFLIHDAHFALADIFLCGDLKYHDFFLASNRMMLADIGHYESEQWVKEWLYAVLIEKFPNFAILISEINTNPVNYL